MFGAIKKYLKGWADDAKQTWRDGVLLRQTHGRMSEGFGIVAPAGNVSRAYPGVIITFETQEGTPIARVYSTDTIPERYIGYITYGEADTLVAKLA